MFRNELVWITKSITKDDVAKNSKCEYVSH